MFEGQYQGMAERKQFSYFFDECYEDYKQYCSSGSIKKDNGTYAFWSSWNERLQTLNHGHYNLQSVEDCEKLFEEFYYEA